MINRSVAGNSPSSVTNLISCLRSPRFKLKKLMNGSVNDFFTVKQCADCLSRPRNVFFGITENAGSITNAITDLTKGHRRKSLLIVVSFLQSLFLSNLGMDLVLFE